MTNGFVRKHAVHRHSQPSSEVSESRIREKPATVFGDNYRADEGGWVLGMARCAERL